MDPCVTCGTTEETTPVCTCDCQCLETARKSGCREIKLLAPTRDTDTAWTENDPIVPEGVLFLVKDRLFEGSLEYAIGDGESKYSELSMLYAGAPLSRTGAQNHSPLAASGKSTLDPSWLPDATSSAKGAVMTSTTGAAGKVPIAASGASALDPSWLPAATSSALGGVMTSTTGAEGKVPIADSSGKLDPSWFPEATSTTLGAVKASTTKAANNVVKADANGGLDGWKDAIIDAIIADDGSGGLVTDDSGNLAVDFSQMPTDKFEALLKSLKMLVPLTANKDVYVDQSHANAGDDPDTEMEIGGVTVHRGDESLPFLTIQGAVDYVTGTYSLGNFNVYIRVKAGTYQESVSLPGYSRGSGACYLISDSGDQDDVVIEPPINAETGTRQTGISASGSYWQVMDLTVHRVENPTTESSAVVGCYHSSGNNTVLAIFGCAAISEVPANLDFTGKTYAVALFRATLGGTIRLYKDPTPGLIQCEKVAGGPTVTVIEVSRSGELVLHKTGTPRTINVSGSCDTFLSMSQMAKMSSLSSGSLISFTDVNNNFTGKRYSLTAGATGLSGLDVNYFPGDVAGTVSRATFCWYNGNETD